MTDTWLSFDDLKRLFKRKRKEIGKCALIAAAALFLFLATRPPVFVAKATFKLGSGKIEQSFDLKNIFRTLVSHNKETSADAIFCSEPVLRKTIEELGMQARLQTQGSFFRFFGFAAANMKNELGREIADGDSAAFQNVSYGGEKAKVLHLSMIGPGIFEVASSKEKVSFSLGEKVQIEDASFTLAKAPACLKKAKPYPLILSPWRDALASAKENLLIKSSKEDPHILSLTFTALDRRFAADFLNALMRHYQSFLKEEAAEVADCQLKYLDSRQNELQERLDQTLQEHVAYLQKQIDERGFVGIHQEIETLSAPQESYTSKLFNIEFDLARFEAGSFADKEKHQALLRERADALSLEEKKQIQAKNVLLTSQIEEASSLLGSVEAGKPLPARPPEHFAPLLGRLQEAKESLYSADEKTKAEKEQLVFAAKEELAQELKAFIHSLSLQQKTLEEGDLYAKTLESDFRGLDLETAKLLSVQYQSQLDALHLALKQLLYLRDQIRDPSFELSSMVNTPLDSITQQMIQKASDVEVKLHDLAHHSSREQARLKEALAMQKKYIAAHIAGTLNLHKIRIELTKEKIASLQAVTIELLKAEKKLVSEKLSDLKGQMAHLPEKWRIENLLKVKKEMTESMVEGLSQIIESKIINRHLYNVESRPLNPAFAPLKPKAPRLFLFAVSAALTAALAAYFFHLLRSTLQGLAPSVCQLKKLGLNSCGSLGPYSAAPFLELSREDRETLRRLANFLEESGAKVALLLEKPYLGIAHSLVELLRHKGKSAIIVDCDFSRIVPKEEIPGLWHYLNQEIEEPKIRSGKISSGGSSRLGTELLQSPRFARLLSRLKSEYDIVICTSRAPLESTEAGSLLQVSDAAAVIYDEETAEILLNWPRQKENSRVTFLQCEAFL